MNKVIINGINVYPFTSEIQLLDLIEKEPKILIAINARKILRATDQTRTIINNNIGYCDGIGALYVLKKKGFKNIIKIPGCELWLKIIEKYNKDKTFYIIGGKQNTIDQTIKKLKITYPTLQILGSRNGFIQNEEEESRLIQDIAEKKPDIVFVAMGSPKQEILMNKMQQRHKAIYQGLGGSLDVYVGNVKRAPKWWIDHNLEGVYRPLVSLSWHKITRFMKTLPFWWNAFLNRY